MNRSSPRAAAQNLTLTQPLETPFERYSEGPSQARNRAKLLPLKTPTAHNPFERLRKSLRVSHLRPYGLPLKTIPPTGDRLTARQPPWGVLERGVVGEMEPPDAHARASPAGTAAPLELPHASPIRQLTEWRPHR